MTENDILPAVEEIGCDGLGMAKEKMDARVTNNSQPDGVVGLVCQSSASPTQSCSQNFPKRNSAQRALGSCFEIDSFEPVFERREHKKPTKERSSKDSHRRYDQYFDCQLTSKKKVMVCCFIS